MAVIANVDYPPNGELVRQASAEFREAVQKGRPLTLSQSTAAAREWEKRLKKRGITSSIGAVN